MYIHLNISLLQDQLTAMYLLSEVISEVEESHSLVTKLVESMHG